MSWESKGTPPYQPPRGNKAVIRDYSPPRSLFNSPLHKAGYFLARGRTVHTVLGVHGSWQLVSKLVYNLFRGLTTYLYRGYNPFTKYHGHPSTLRFSLKIWFFFSPQNLSVPFFPTETEAFLSIDVGPELWGCRCLVFEKPSSESLWVSEEIQGGGPSTWNLWMSSKSGAWTLQNKVSFPIKNPGAPFGFKF